MNFKAIIFACDDDELLVILDAMILRNKRLLCEFIQQHPDLIIAPVTPPEEPEPTELTEEQAKDLQEITLGTIKSISKDKLGASLEDVIKEVIPMDYTREQILDSIDHLLDLGEVYEPDIGFIRAVI